MTYEQYLEASILAKIANPEWRIGQTFSNVLHTHRRDLWKRVYLSNVDPFQKDSLVDPFLRFIKELW